jgi:hypothetical protein
MSVHNITREAMQPGDVYIGRRPGRFRHMLPRFFVDGTDGYFGNPHVIDGATSREQAVRAFEESARRRLREDPEYRDRVRTLEGKRLFCYCAPQACHGEVLERMAGELAEAERMQSEGGPG